MPTPPRMTVSLMLCGSVLLAGCSAAVSERKANRLLEQGQEAEGLAMLAELGRTNPLRHQMTYVRTRDSITNRMLREARQWQQRGQSAEALNRYRDILAFDPANAQAMRALEMLARAQRQQTALQQAKADLAAGDPTQALNGLGRILAENPGHTEARQLQQQVEIDRNRETLLEPPLRASLRKPVSLEFRSATIQAVFDVLSQSSGLNFIFDRDVKTDVKTTIYARNTSIEDALSLVLRTSQLERKVLNDSTLLIYPATPDKQKQYAELVVRSFYLEAADPKKVQEMLRALVNPKSMYVDDKMRLLVVRDTLDVIDTVEKLVRNVDLVEPEVSLEVEILEVSSDQLLNLGIQYPDQLKASVSGAAGKAGELTVNDITSLGKNNFKLFVPDPLATLNFKQTSGDANILANPKLRVRNREKAKIMVGDKVPVVTTTTNQASSSVSESVNYLDVGLKLDVEPEIHVNNDVSITVGLEVSNIVKEVKTSTGLLTYQIGTRNASTVLRLHDGETQMLAGLIKNEERNSASHLPGLGKLPWLGKLFSNESNTHTKSEVVLLITPHVVRGLDTPAANGVEFLSGTGNDAGGRSMRLPASGQYSLTRPELVPGGKGGTAGVGLESIPQTMKPAALVSDSVIPFADPGLDLPQGEVLGAAVRAPDVRLDMVSPAQIPVGKEFTVALMLSGDGFESLDFDLVSDKAGLELVRVTPLAQAGGFEYLPGDSKVHFHLGALQRHGGPLLMLTLRAGASGAGQHLLSIVRATGRKSGDVILQVQPPAARELQVLP